MNYIYAHSSPFTTQGVIVVEVLDESEVFDILYSKVGLTNQFDTLEELINFIYEYDMLLDNTEAITVATLSGDTLLQT